MGSVAVDERRLELKKHINLIHCSNNLSLVQRKLFNALLFNAYSELLTKNQFVISARELCNIIGYKSNDYKSLKNALLGLMKVTIEWDVIDASSKKGMDKWRASTALSSASLEKGICTYEYSTVMKELFYQPEIYGRINIALLPKFKSSYGLALYENCARYSGISQTPWFSLDVFRRLMGVLDDKYAIFRDFKRRVLDIAINEVNSYSSINISPDIKRLNNKVVSIRFKLELKKESVLQQINKVSQDGTLLNTLKEDFGLSSKIIEELFLQYEYDYIQEKVSFILNSESFRLGKIRELSGYLIEALRNDYKNKPSKVLLEKNRRAKERHELDEKKKNETLREEYNQYISSMIDSHISKVSPDNLELINKEFEQYVKEQGSIIYKFFKNGGMDHPAIKALFHSFIKKKEFLDLKEILSFEEFEKQQKKH